jgi:hypothetical protein
MWREDDKDGIKSANLGEGGQRGAEDDRVGRYSAHVGRRGKSWTNVVQI